MSGIWTHGLSGLKQMLFWLNYSCQGILVSIQTCSQYKERCQVIPLHCSHLLHKHFETPNITAWTKFSHFVPDCHSDYIMTKMYWNNSRCLVIYHWNMKYRQFCALLLLIKIENGDICKPVFAPFKMGL